MNDPGTAVVDHVYSTMQIDARWSVRGERGFTWWGKDFAQRIWADPPFEEEGSLVSRIHACTGIVRGFSVSADGLSRLAWLNRLAALEGFVWDPRQPDRVVLAASIYAHDQNLAMTRRLFSLAVAMQAARAQSFGRMLAWILGAELDASPHPTSGFRPDADDMLNVVERMVVPGGRRESRWPGEEMEQAVSLFSGPPCVLCTGDRNGLAAEFPLGRATALLRVDAREKHSELGSGLLMRLSLPFVRSVTEYALEAVALNALELQEDTRAAFLGSWCADANGVHFVSFYPNCIHAPGLLPNLVLNMALRARWVAEKVYGGDWSSSYAQAVEEKARLLHSLLPGDSE